jgi:hypothetical protein
MAVEYSARKRRQVSSPSNFTAKRLLGRFGVLGHPRQTPGRDPNRSKHGRAKKKCADLVARPPELEEIFEIAAASNLLRTSIVALASALVADVTDSNLDEVLHREKKYFRQPQRTAVDRCSDPENAIRW